MWVRPASGRAPFPSFLPATDPEPVSWRTLTLDDREWRVSVAVERRPGTTDWTLVAAFRSTGADGARIWVPLDISSPSKAALFARADAMSQDDLAAALRRHLEP